MIGVVIGKVEKEDMEAAINGLREAELAGEGMDSANATVGNTVGAIGNIIVDVVGGKHGLATTAEVCLVKASSQTPFVVIKPSS